MVKNINNAHHDKHLFSPDMHLLHTKKYKTKNNSVSTGSECFFYKMPLTSNTDRKRALKTMQIAGFQILTLVRSFCFLNVHSLCKCQQYTQWQESGSYFRKNTI